MNSHYIGIDLGGTRVKIGLVREGKVVARKVIPADAAGGLGASLPVVRAEVDELLETYRVDSFDGIGLAFPGLVDPASQRILSTNKKYDDALRVDVPRWVREHWNVPFFIDNDARMAAVGEWKYGEGRGTDDLVVMTIGTGIGTSTIIGGRLLRGRHFQAGCLGGHISVQYEGRECTCGNSGCLEAYGSTWSLAGRVEGITDFEGLFDAVAAGNAQAADVLRDCYDVWSAGIVNLIHAYDPEVVVLGGGVMHHAEAILPYVREKVHRHAWTPWGKVSIRATQLHGDAGVLGVTHCLKEHI
ncbi:MAG: ROK family protein [Bacteroidetes bacterium]|nr:ROK family protein [Bacteroidota bacterium]